MTVIDKTIKYRTMGDGGIQKITTKKMLDGSTKTSYTGWPSYNGLPSLRRISDLIKQKYCDGDDIVEIRYALSQMEKYFPQNTRSQFYYAFANYDVTMLYEMFKAEKLDKTGFE